MCAAKSLVSAVTIKWWYAHNLIVIFENTHKISFAFTTMVPYYIVETSSVFNSYTFLFDYLFI